MVSLKPGISVNLSDYKRIQDAQQRDMKNIGHGSYRILGKKNKDFSRSKIIFSRTCLFDIEWHLPFTPAVLFVFFVSGVRFQRALLTSHTIYTKFFSFQPWMNSPRLCVEGQITIYYCTDTDPSALLTVSPPLFQFKTILKILVLQFHIKVSRPFKYIGGGGVRLLQYLPPGRLGY